MYPVNYISPFNNNNKQDNDFLSIYINQPLQDTKALQTTHFTLVSLPHASTSGGVMGTSGSEDSVTAGIQAGRNRKKSNKKTCTSSLPRHFTTLLQTSA